MDNPKIRQSSLPNDVLITDELHRRHSRNGLPKREIRTRMADVTFDGKYKFPAAPSEWARTIIIPRSGRRAASRSMASGLIATPSQTPNLRRSSPPPGRRPIRAKTYGKIGPGNRRWRLVHRRLHQRLPLGGHPRRNHGRPRKAATAPLIKGRAPAQPGTYSGLARSSLCHIPIVPNEITNLRSGNDLLSVQFAGSA
jgi:hypothetical protein